MKRAYYFGKVSMNKVLSDIYKGYRVTLASGCVITGTEEEKNMSKHYRSEVDWEKIAYDLRNKPPEPDFEYIASQQEIEPEILARQEMDANDWRIHLGDHIPSLHMALEEGKGKSSMNKEDYLDFHVRFCMEMMEITKAKNEDYTGEGDDPFANFTMVEKNSICSTEVGFLTRMSDKMARINSFCQKGELQVKDESVKDTLMDLANYAILFAAYLESKNGNN